MYRFMLLFVFFLSFQQSNAQKIDSLLRATKVETDPETKIRNYLSLCRLLRYDDFQSSKRYGELAVALAQKHQLIQSEGDAFSRLGFVHLDTGKFAEASGFYRRLQEIGEIQKDTFLLAKAFNGQGLIQWRKEQMDLALKSFQKTYEYSKAVNDHQLYKYALNNMGLVNVERGNYEIGISYFKKLYVRSKELDDKNGLFLSMVNLANIQIIRAEYDEAKKNLEECMYLIEKQESMSSYNSVILHFGHLYKSMGAYQKALKYINECVNNAKKYNLNDQVISCYLLYAQVYNKMGKHQQAVQFANRGIELSSKATYTDPEFYQLLANSNEKIGQFKIAYKAQKQFQNLSDSLFNLKKQKEFAALEVSFQTKEKEAENLLLQKDKIAHQAESKQKSVIILTGAIGLLLLLMLAFQLFRMRKKDHQIKSYLEEEVQKRTGELKLINTQLVLSNEELKRFAYIASHDLKEPLRNISGFISLIKRRGKNLSKEDFAEYFGFIEKSNAQMADLVDSILKYSKLDTNREATREATDLSQIIEDVKILLIGTLRKRKIKIVYQDLPTIRYYPYVIKTVFKNLIENGIKYNESEQPKITISARRHDEQLYIYIKDNGIGIHPDYHQKVFAMFSRLNNRKNYTGSGMGLAFCKKILVKYQGDVSVTTDTNIGSGSTFLIKLNVETIDTSIENLIL